MPLYHQTGDIHQAVINDPQWQGPVRAEPRVGALRRTPWRNGTTHVIFEPLDFIARLVALVPKPRVNLIRFHGVFAPNSKYRSKVTLARRGRRKKCHAADEADQTPAEKRASMTWAKRLKRVFNIDITTCDQCGADVRIIASIA